MPETPVAHNLALSADGKLGLLGSMSSPRRKAGLAVIDVPNRKVLRYMTFSEMVRPLTINHDASLVYVNVNDLIGFEIGDVQTGKMLERCGAARRRWKGKGYSHGIGMTPDESEIWVADPVNDAWQVWDNPGDGRNPVYNASKMMKPTAGVEHSWIDDEQRRQAGLPRRQQRLRREDAQGNRGDEGRIRPADRPHGEGSLLTFKDGKLIEANNQFAVGDAKAYAARMAGGKDEQLTGPRLAVCPAGTRKPPGPQLSRTAEGFVPSGTVAA